MMMIWIEPSKDGSVMTGYRPHPNGLRKAMKITELDGEWVLEINGEVASIPAPDGDCQSFIEAIMGSNQTITADKQKPAMLFKGPRYSFDCYIDEAGNNE